MINQGQLKHPTAYIIHLKAFIRIDVRRKLLIFSLLSLAVMGVVVYAVYNSNQKLIEAEEWTQRTQKVIYLSGNILSLVNEIESASQSFVLTNNNSFLLPLYSAGEITRKYVREIKQLIADNPLQLRRADSLNFYMQHRLDIAFELTGIRSKKGFLAAITYASATQGNEYKGHLRRITNAIQYESNALLKRRKQISGHTRLTLKQSYFTGVILIVLFIILLFIIGGNYLLQQKHANKIRQLNTGLEQKLIEHTANRERYLIARDITEKIAADKEIAYEHAEKEKRAAELTIANKELSFQNKEKEKRAAELANTNKELKKAEDDIRRLNEELEQKVIKRTGELESANKELESFAYSVSHDLRAPLRAVHGYARILNEDYGTQFNAEASRVVGNIINNSKKMGQLIDDLLTFSRLGRKELIKVNVPMHEIAANICNEVKNEQEKRNIQFSINELNSARGDVIALKQVWVNLISNAVKFSKLTENAIIEINSAIKGNEVIYSIKDNGAGFDMRYANKLFGVFQRLHSQEMFEGTGVGLAIVHRIITKHGGSVWAESEVNKGTVFYFSLPESTLSKFADNTIPAAG